MSWSTAVSGVSPTVKKPGLAGTGAGVPVGQYT